MHSELSRQQKRFLSMAIALAKTSECRQKHGCVIVSSSRVVSVGVNRFRNHPANVDDRHISNGCSIHAEIVALRNAQHHNNLTVYVARVNRRGQTRLSRPCNTCYTELIRIGVKTIIYT